MIDLAGVKRMLREARVQGYEQALADTGPRPRDAEQARRWREYYRADAERRVSEGEAQGLFNEFSSDTTDIERVA